MPAAAMPDTHDIAALRRILRAHRRIAVVGLSAEWHRPSFFAAKYMQAHGYEIIPVNPKHAEILGVKSHPALEDIRGEVGIVDVFRRAECAPEIARAAVAIRAKVLWLQLGVISEEAARIARDGGLEVVMDRCVKIEHARLFGGLNFIGVNTGVNTARRNKIIAN
ncbi:MAG: CoA-binding protein [Gammaproteobacteria bacterium]